MVASRCDAFGVICFHSLFSRTQPNQPLLSDPFSPVCAVLAHLTRSQRKRWKGAEKKRALGHRLDDARARKLHKAKWRSQEASKYASKHNKHRSSAAKWRNKSAEMTKKKRKHKSKTFGSD